MFTEVFVHIDANRERYLAELAEGRRPTAFDLPVSRAEAAPIQRLVRASRSGQGRPG